MVTASSNPTHEQKEPSFYDQAARWMLRPDRICCLDLLQQFSLQHATQEPDTDGVLLSLRLGTAVASK